MEIYKKILAILICVSTIPAMFLLGGCNEEDVTKSLHWRKKWIWRKKSI